MNSILSRRSIRKYTDKPIPEDMIDQLLRAAMAAPSAGNEQPWHFVVIDDHEVLKAIPNFHPFASMLKEARCAIVVCGDLSKERHKGYWVQDCSAATQNLLLMAQELDLGAVWLGVYPIEDRVKPLQALLGLPETVIPLSIVPIGFPAEYREPADRFDATRVHRNTWQQP